jgi:hypothetical protein
MSGPPAACGALAADVACGAVWAQHPTLRCLPASVKLRSFDDVYESSDTLQGVYPQARPARAVQPAARRLTRLLPAFRRPDHRAAAVGRQGRRARGVRRARRPLHRGDDRQAAPRGRLRRWRPGAATSRILNAACCAVIHRLRSLPCSCACCLL